MDAWSQIVALAAARVEKSDGSLSAEQGVDAVLKSAAGRALYATYCEEQAAAIAEAGLDPWANPGVVAKQDEADDPSDPWAEIMREADAYFARNPTYDGTREQCISKVLKNCPELYTRFLEARVGAPGMKPDTPTPVRKAAPRVKLSKAAEEFIASFEEWLTTPGGHVAKSYDADGRLASWGVVPASKAAAEDVEKADGPLRVLGFDSSLFDGIDW